MNRIVLSAVVVGVLCGGLVAAGGQGEVIVVGEGRTAVVVLPADLDPETETVMAAIELSHYVGKITGRELPVIAEGRGQYRKAGAEWQVVPFAKLEARPTGKPEIHVGWTSRALREIDRAGVEKLDIDGHLIRTTPEAIFLVGPKDWSTAYACFTFLEELCGVRWYLPGEFGEDVPRRAALAVPVINNTYEPAYLHRVLSGTHKASKCRPMLGRQYKPLMARWRKHRRIRGRMRYHHNLYIIFHPSKYAEKYPDIYPLISGERRIPGGPKGPKIGSQWQPCLTHPKAVDLVVEYARDFFAKNPDDTSISISVNDGFGFCECENCMKLVDPAKPRDRSLYFYQFANAVAERFDTLFPDKEIGYYRYLAVQAVPETMKLNPRLITFDTPRSWYLIVPELKKKFDERLVETSGVSPRFGLYDVCHGGAFFSKPMLWPKQSKYYLEHGYEMGARYSHSTAYMNWGLDGFRYWIYAKLLWDPSLSVDAMMDEFFPRFFKESAEPMREYFRIVEKYTVTPVWAEGKEHTGPWLTNFWYHRSGQFESFPPQAVRECEPLLEKAEKMAQADIVRERVRYFRNGFNVAKMLSLRYHYHKQAFALLQKAETVPEGIALLEKILLSEDLDVPAYYKRVLGNDRRFCVNYPHRRNFWAPDGMPRHARPMLENVVAMPEAHDDDKAYALCVIGRSYHREDKYEEARGAYARVVEMKKAGLKYKKEASEFLKGTE